MAGIGFDFRSDASELVKDQAEVIKNMNKMISTLRQQARVNETAREQRRKDQQVSKAKRAADREEQKLTERGQALTKEVATAQEVFNQKLREAISLKDQGKISAETLRRQYARLKSEYQATTDEGKALARAEKERAAAMRRGEQVTRQLEKSTDKYKRELRELKNLHAQGAIDIETMRRGRARLSQEFRQGLDTKPTGQAIAALTSQLGQYASAAGAVALTVRSIGAAFETVRTEQEAALSALEGTGDANRRLLQVSESPEQFVERRQTADDLSSEFGVDRNTVRDVLFSGISEGFESVVPDIIRANQVIAPEVAASVAGQIPGLFKNQEIAPLEAVSGTLLASQDSRVDFEELGAALPQAAEGVASVGGTFSEAAASLAELSAAFKSPDTAADRIKAFGVAASLDEDLKGLGLIGAVEKLQSLSDAEQSDFLGEGQELNVAFRVLGERIGEIKELNAAIQADRVATSKGQGLLEERVQFSLSDEDLSAVRELNKARIQQEVLQARVDGITGAKAESAIKIAQSTNRLVNSLPARALNTLTGGQLTNVPARALSSVGVPKKTAGGIGALVPALASNPIPAAFAVFKALLPRQQPPPPQPPKPVQAEVTVEASVYERAVGKFDAAVDKMAAAQHTTAEPILRGAREAAAQAGVGN